MDLIRHPRCGRRLRACAHACVVFVTRKQGVEESRRIETPDRRRLRYDCTQDSHKIFTFDRVAKSVFKVLASAMALSHYAVVFFCAQRNRVTLREQHVSAIAFCKDGRVHKYRDRLARVRCENILPAAKPHQIKFERMKIVSRGGMSRNAGQKVKSPAWPGFCDDRVFRSTHLASLAIWCESRETLRLALFL
jgi:hypothetical protein